jgi:hypothetical protein
VFQKLLHYLKSKQNENFVVNCSTEVVEVVGLLLEILLLCEPYILKYSKLRLSFHLQKEFRIVDLRI